MTTGKLFRILIGIFCFLHSPLAAKDYVWERYYASYEYLINQYGSSLTGTNDEKFVKAFAIEYLNQNKNIVHSIIIDKEGQIMFDGEYTSLSTAKDKIMSHIHLSSKPIVLFSAVVWGKKSEKAFNKLMKQVTKLVKEREDKGYSFHTLPVLCNNVLSWEKISNRIKELEYQAAVESFIETPTISNQETDKTKRAQEETKLLASKEKTEASITQQKEMTSENLLNREQTPIIEDNFKLYIVNVNTSLTIRQYPSLNSKKIGSLTNNEEISVFEIKDGWAKIVYNNEYAYVNSLYIIEKNGLKTNSDTSLKLFESSVYEFIYFVAPFLILLFTILLIFMKENGSKILIFLIGLAELLFSIAFTETGDSGFPWFCNPDKVGWIMTIIDFLLLSGVLYMQYGMYKQFMRELRLGCVAYLLSFPIIIGIGFALLSIFTYPLFGMVASLIAVLIVWIIINWQINDNFSSLMLAFWTIISFGGATALFLKTTPVLIVGGIILTIIKYAGEGSKHNSAYGENNSDEYDTDGHIEKSADGVPFVRHRNGSTTQLHNSGGGVMSDNKGRIWHNDDGYAKRIT